MLYGMILPAQSCRLSSGAHGCELSMFTQWTLCSLAFVVQALWQWSAADLAGQAVYRRVITFLCRLFNSFTDGLVPCYYKEAYITPRIKKANLNLTETRSYRPVSNLPVVS